MTAKQDAGCGRRHAGGGDRRDFRLPGAHAHYPPDRVADIRHLRLEVDVNPEARSIDATATLTLAPISAPLSRLPFDLVEMTVDAVSSGGRELAFHHEGGTLEVSFAPPVPVGEPVEVTIRYHGSPRIGLNFILPDEGYPDRPVQVWSQGQDEYSRYWIPSHDHPQQKSTTEVIATAPAHYRVVSNGELVSSEAHGDRTTWHYRQDVVHSSYLVSIVVGEFDTWTEEAAGVRLEYYVPPGTVEIAKPIFARTGDMVRMLEDLTGQPYPWVKYAQLIVHDFTWGGMENTSATTLNEVYLHTGSALLERNYDHIVVHELAHQWFGDLLTCRDWSEGWLNEGFASYAEPLWFEHLEGIDSGHLYRLKDAATVFAEDSEYRRPIVFRNYVEAGEAWDSHIYEKGAWVLWMLRKVVGDELFKASVREYVRRHRGGSVVTSDLLKAFEDVTGRSLGWFFDQWIHGGGHPEFKVNYGWDADRGVADVKVRQVQDIDEFTHVFRAPLLVAFGQPGAAPMVHEVEVGVDGDPEDGFSFALPARPTWVRFDRENRVFKTLDFDRPTELLVAQLAEDETSGRIEAASSLGARPTPAGVAALGRALRDDDFYGVRMAAAHALGESRTTAGRDLLVAGPADANPRVRRAVAAALKNWRHDPAVTAALVATIDSDPADYVVGAAAKALGRTGAAEAGPVLGGLLNREGSHREVVRKRALDGLAALGEIEYLPAMLAFCRPPFDWVLRQVATRAVARLVMTAPKEARRPVVDIVRELLRDRLYFVRAGAISACVTLADAGLLTDLRWVEANDVMGEVRNQARAAIASLGAGASPDDALRSLRDEVDHLRRRHDELADRLARLEPPTAVENS